VSTTIQEVAGALNAFFRSKVPNVGVGSTGDILLVFDALGAPLNPAEFGLGLEPGQESVFASQRAAQIADELPAANLLLAGSWLPRGGSRFSRFYRTAVEESRSTATSESARSAFESRRAAARRSLDENRLLDVAMPGVGTVPVGVTDAHYVTGMSPSAWFHPASSNWAHYSQAEQSATPGVLVEPVIPIPEFVLHIPPDDPDPPVEGWLGNARKLALLPTKAQRVDPASFTSGLSLVRAATGSRLFRAADDGSLERIRPVRFLEADVTTEAQLRFVGERSAAFEASEARPVQSEDFSISFDYCIVSFDRPWWDELFLAADGWELPGFSIGELASGSGSAPASLITLVTTGMIVIRNLVIAANWQDGELATAQAASSLGPFCIAGAELHDVELRRPGLQAIAWLCQVPPVLPPGI
jgi:hypothetical protein